MKQSPSTIDLTVPPPQRQIDRALQSFSRVVQHRFGARLKGIFLFGSRARGDFGPFSDVDVAVVLDDSAKRASEMTILSGFAYDVFLETGAEIQPWAFAEGEWNSPARSSSAGLIRAAKRDGRIISL